MPYFAAFLPSLVAPLAVMPQQTNNTLIIFTPRIIHSIKRSKTVVRILFICHSMPQYAPRRANKGFSAILLPWQTNSILIILNFLLDCRDMPHFAHFFEFSLTITLFRSCVTLCKTGQNEAACNNQTYTYRIRI